MRRPHFLNRRRCRRQEEFIGAYVFPEHIGSRVLRRYPSIGTQGWREVEEGLREWFICCAWVPGRTIGMPSRVVDEAWHEMILDSIAYTVFCEMAFGRYLHHTPDERLLVPAEELLGSTVRAWDRSVAGRERESRLWDLDERLGIPEPLGIGDTRLVALRSAGAGSRAGRVADWFLFGDGGGDGIGWGALGDFGGGDGGGGGCGGGGCGGG